MRFEKRTPELRLKLEGWRSRFVFFAAAAGFCVLAGRAFYLQGMNTTFLQAKGEQRYARVLEMPASRGPVKDRHGQLLAVSTAVESIKASPEDLVDLDDAHFARLAAALGMEVRELRQKIANKDRQSVFLKRQIPPEQAAKVMALRIPGVFQAREWRRYYPSGEVMAHVVGFTDIEDKGQEGIELAAQRRLAGTAGSRRVIQDRKGRVVDDAESLRVPRDGSEVNLALDQRLQFIAHRELKATVEQFRARAGSMVILDARTGEVLALVNLPDYNPNNRATVTGPQTRNRSVTDLYEPGSTMKPFTVSLALDAGIVKPETLVETGNGAIKIGNWTINDAHPMGTLTVAQVISKSSNIGAARIQLQMPAEKVGGMYRELGFGAVPATGFPGEAKGILRPWATWKTIEQATMAYGHGISVSLLQMARAYTVFTNDGQLLPLSLMKLDGQPVGRPIFSAKSIGQIIPMMEAAVAPSGTAPQARVPGYRVAGKTGTAHKPEAGGYAEHKYVSSFVGFAPVSAPRFIVAVMIDEPQGAKHYGGDVAGPVFSTVMGNALRLMDVPPDAPQTVNAQAAEPRRVEIASRKAET